MSSAYWKPALTTSPMNNVWLPTSTRLAHLAFDEGDGLIENRRASDAVVERELVHRVRGGVDLDRLGELAHDRTVLTLDQVQAEHPTLVDQLVGERLLLDRDAEQLRDRSSPGSPSSASSRCDVTSGCPRHRARRHRPEHPAAQPVVFLGVGAVGERTNRTTLYRHARELRSFWSSARTKRDTRQYRVGAPLANCQTKRDSGVTFCLTVRLRYAPIPRASAVRPRGCDDSGADACDGERRDPNAQSESDGVAVPADAVGALGSLAVGHTPDRSLAVCIGRIERLDADDR